MSKRISTEQRILDYFDQQPLATAEAIFNLVAGRMKQRRAAEAPRPARTKVSRMKTQPEMEITA